MDADALAERILKDLDNIFSKDPFIAEVDVVPLEECVQNKCPVIHVAHQVAIESWCIKHVYQYAYMQLLEWRSRPHKIDANILLGWTRAVLIINPDIQVAWNVRRELVCNQKQEVKDELQFSSIVLTRKPKCSEVFTHRRWLLERLVQSNSEWTGLPPDLVDIETNLCQKAASAYPHNYYAWSHRIWAVQRADVPPEKMVLKELESTDEWVESHVSDHSGFQFRQFLYTWWLKHYDLDSLPNHCQLLPVCLTGCNDYPSSSQKPNEIFPSLLHEMDTNTKLILFYKGHEALWYHRRFILNTLCPLISRGKVSVPNEKDLSQRIKRNKLDAALELSGLGYEVYFLRDCLEQGQNDPGQIMMAERHKEWIQKVLAPSLPNN